MLIYSLLGSKHTAEFMLMVCSSLSWYGGTVGCQRSDAVLVCVALLLDLLMVSPMPIAGSGKCWHENSSGLRLVVASQLLLRLGKLTISAWAWALSLSKVFQM